MSDIATKFTWSNAPMEQPKRIEMPLVFNDEEYESLKRGFIPMQMEDKWLIYFEDDWLHFHRSWTGDEIYKAKVEPGQGEYVINEFWVERNSRKYKNEDDDEDRENLYFLIAKGLLRIDAGDHFFRRNVRNERDALKAWSSFGRMLYVDTIPMLQDLRSALFGLAVGDALGVPAEFKSREELKLHPIKDMVGHGSHDVPAGTWSDDSSLTFCLAEALAEEFDLRAVSQNFQNWLYHNYWTPRGEVFDVGIATRKAINNLRGGVKPELAGGANESDNGNGSLMRILPLVFFIKDKPIEERFEITKAVSSLTHRHIRSVIACFYYLEFTLGLLETKNAFYVYKELKTIVPAHLRAIEVDSAEIQLFHRLFVNDIDSLHEEEIQSSGYVLHTLEASIWCLLTTGSYKEAVLKAVNLGEDTDSTAAVTGGLAGLLYGIEHIPGNWMSMLARSEDIEDLARRMYKRLDN